MIHDETVLAVIPARGGSKRCPRKNARAFRGKPLIAWSLEAAKGSRYIDRTVLSTEDQEIALLSGSLFLLLRSFQLLDRPTELATDDATNEDVLRYVLTIYPAEWVVLLQPTSPLRTATDIDAAIERAQMGNACISYRRDGTKNGAVYVARASWLAEHDFTCIEHMRYVMPDERSLDIDWPSDFNAG